MRTFKQRHNDLLLVLVYILISAIPFWNQWNGRFVADNILLPFFPSDVSFNIFAKGIFIDELNGYTAKSFNIAIQALICYLLESLFGQYGFYILGLVFNWPIYKISRTISNNVKDRVLILLSMGIVPMALFGMPFQPNNIHGFIAYIGFVGALLFYVAPTPRNALIAFIFLFISPYGFQVPILQAFLMVFVYLSNNDKLKFKTLLTTLILIIVAEIPILFQTIFEFINSVQGYRSEPGFKNIDIYIGTATKPWDFLFGLGINSAGSNGEYKRFISASLILYAPFLIYGCYLLCKSKSLAAIFLYFTILLYVVAPSVPLFRPVASHIFIYLEPASSVFRNSSYLLFVLYILLHYLVATRCKENLKTYVIMNLLLLSVFIVYCKSGDNKNLINDKVISSFKSDASEINYGDIIIEFPLTINKSMSTNLVVSGVETAQVYPISYWGVKGIHPRLDSIENLTGQKLDCSNIDLFSKLLEKYKPKFIILTVKSTKGYDVSCIEDLIKHIDKKNVFVGSQLDVVELNSPNSNNLCRINKLLHCDIGLPSKINIISFLIFLFLAFAYLFNCIYEFIKPSIKKSD